MGDQVVGVFLGWSEPPKGGGWKKWWRAVWFKANPRGEDYMRSLFEERFPDGRFMNVRRDSRWHDAVAEAECVVLLYPDAIGLQFAALELGVWSNAPSRASVHVLNGRRRLFRLNAITLLALWMRRLLEVTMLMELCFTAVFVAVTPLLWASDWLRGRR